jgi:ribonucleoside-diphosphate reductase alpha chain
MTNLTELSDSTANSSFELVKRLSSTGYLRKRVPQNLMGPGGILDGGIVLGDASDSLRVLKKLVPEINAGQMDPVDIAKLQGYEGEACNDCGNYTLVRNGTCMKCNTCGGTSGCS